MYNVAENSVSLMKPVSSPVWHGQNGPQAICNARGSSGRKQSLHCRRQSYLRPWTVFELYLWLEEYGSPLYVLATVTLIEHREDGYHLLMNLAGIERSDRERLDLVFHASDLWKEKAEAAETEESHYSTADSAAAHLDVRDALTEATQKRLRDLNVRVDIARTLRNTMQSLSTQRYDAVLAEYFYQPDDHLTLVRELAMCAQRANSRLILICPRGLRRELEQGLAAGAHAVISRPQPEAQLADLLCDTLRQNTADASQDPPAQENRQMVRGWHRAATLGAVSRRWRPTCAAPVSAFRHRWNPTYTHIPTLPDRESTMSLCGVLAMEFVTDRRCSCKIESVVPVALARAEPQSAWDRNQGTEQQSGSLTIGTVVDGRFVIERSAGRGGMATVHRPKTR